MRIIGGRWRGTRLAVPEVAGLRPTSDRVRETLFNWLMPVLPGARVVDLFAGSGALGLEAVSRGAAQATLVERDRALADALRQTAQRLAGDASLQVVQADALQWLSTQARASFDIAFVDPPFADHLWQRAITALEPVLAADAWLYVEAASPDHVAPGPQWLLHREGSTRDVVFRLYRRIARATDTLAATVGEADPHILS